MCFGDKGIGEKVQMWSFKRTFRMGSKFLPLSMYILWSGFYNFLNIWFLMHTAEVKEYGTLSLIPEKTKLLSSVTLEKWIFKSLDNGLILKYSFLYYPYKQNILCLFINIRSPFGLTFYNLHKDEVMKRNSSSIHSESSFIWQGKEEKSDSVSEKCE